MNACWSPEKGALPPKTGKNIRSSSKEPKADGRTNYNMVRPGSPRGSIETLQSIQQCHAAFSTIPSTMAWVNQSPLARGCRSNPQQGISSTTVAASHVTRGTVRIHDILRYGRWVGFMGCNYGEYCIYYGEYCLIQGEYF